MRASAALAGARYVTDRQAIRFERAGAVAVERRVARDNIRSRMAVRVLARIRRGDSPVGIKNAVRADTRAGAGPGVGAL